MIDIQVSTGKSRKKFESFQAAVDHFGINYQTFYQRHVVNGWPVKEALTTPVRRKRKARKLRVN